MIDRKFINDLKPAELELISSYIFDLVKKKVTPLTSNHENIEVKCCPHCGSVHFVRNGHDRKGKQKYLCRDCKAVFLSTTGTVFSRSRISYSDWTSFIASELNCLTLEEESIQISRSKTTCFNMRHKLYKAISEIMDDSLSGLIELDPTYQKINLKGTKPENMPRFSKKRGKNNSRKGKRGFNGHEVCILSAVDENDHILLKVAGLGEESTDKLDHFISFFKKGSTIISDSKDSIIKFVRDNHFISDVIPSLGGKKRYRTDKGNSLSSVNQLHQDIEVLKYRKRGVSTRHLPGYLNWIVFRKKIRYSFEARNRRSEAYMKMIGIGKSLINPDVCKVTMPIDLYKAYGNYHYGIFANGRTYPEDLYDGTGLLNQEKATIYQPLT